MVMGSTLCSVRVMVMGSTLCKSRGDLGKCRGDLGKCFRVVLLKTFELTFTRGETYIYHFVNMHYSSSKLVNVVFCYEIDA